MKRADLSHDVRQTLKRLPPPYDSHYGVVPTAPPELPPSVIPVAERHAAAMRALARLETLVAELGDPWLVSRVLVRREAVSSSAIEGTNSTLDALLTLEETGEDAQSGQAAARQIRDYTDCLGDFLPRAREQGVSIFTECLVRALHCATMKGAPGYADAPGALRTRVVWIGGTGDIAYSTYNPPPPEDIARCLADNIAFMRDDPGVRFHTSPVTRMAVAHAHFEAVHPFRDGNGRVGRLLLPLMMASEGHVPLYLSPYMETHRAAYYAALKDAQQRLVWHAIIGFMADAVTATVEELLATRAALLSLRKIWLARRRFRRGSAALRALDVLPHYPVITVGRLASRLAVTWPQAATAIRQLTEAGILVERTGYRRNRLFAAQEALSVINRPFGAEPVLPTVCCAQAPA